MNKKRINILILISQWLLSILLGIYLIVPFYENNISNWKGQDIYSPYKNWKQNPLNIVQFKNKLLTGSKPDSILQLYPFYNQSDIILIDSIDHSLFSPFILGHSENDLQYLINKSDTNLLLAYAANSDFDTPLKGIQVQMISSENDLEKLDKELELGLAMTLLADESDSKYSYNMLLSRSNSASDCLNAIKKGENLIVFSDNEIFYSSLKKIPVIRKIEWKNNELNLDLSQKGNISIVSSEFKLDTLSSRLKLKIKDSDWFRFSVIFEKEGISYFSNPFFKYSNSTFDVPRAKTNNQLTIFLNLSWLIVIILINTFLNRIRKKYF